MVTQHLFELLYEHNCVVVPGFGGFIANRLPSKVNEIQQRVEPPRKVVAFNINLTQNDGLLADYIAKKNNYTFDEANFQIREFVEQVNSEIQLKRHYALKGIGDFYLNSENSIVFIPEADINFAKDTYGLFPVTIRKILRDAEIVKTVEKEKLRSKTLPLRKESNKRSRKWIYGAALIALPLVIGLFTQQSGILQKADFNISSLFKQEPVIPNSSQNKTESKKEESIPTTQPKTEDKKAEEAIPAIVPPIIKEEPKVEQAAKSNDIVSNAEVKHFHVIGGSFAVPTNAQNFLKQLQAKGYKAYIAGTNARGLAMVSYGGFASETSALELLQTIHQTENGQAWLLNN